MMNYKTPGVYIEEVPLFPPSIAGVATAVPAFVGHTQNTTDPNGDTLINRPVRLTSFVEFTGLFGGPYAPDEYTVQTDPDDGYSLVNISPSDGKRFFLFDSVRHYFDNGGGPCYIVSTGDYDGDVAYGDLASGLRGGLYALEKVDEVTLLVIPDSAALNLETDEQNVVQAGNLHKDMMEQCGRLKDRFAILDMVNGHRAAGTTPESDPVHLFRNETGTENLKYGATYYPWLRTTYAKNVRFTQLRIVDNEDPPAPVDDSDIDTMTGNPELDGRVTALRARIAEEERIFDKISGPELDRSNYSPMSSHFDRLRDEVAEASTAAEARPAFTAMIRFVRDMVLGLQDLESEATDNSADLNRLIASLKEDESLQEQIVLLIGYEKNEQVRNSISTGRDVSDVENDYTALDEEDWIGGVTLGSIAVDGTDYSGSSIAETARQAANSPVLQTAFEEIAQAFASVIEESLYYTNREEAALFSSHPFFKAISERVQKTMSLLPPSGAAAGVYATTDRNRGVWKAPANMSLRSVVAPAVKLTSREQESLNVHTTGKSVNAIRAFTGKGVLVWGARTLAGNDNEWRYINVRRLFIYVEESAKKATGAFVFEANDANTWIRIRAMIENFLTLQWRQGALAGATPNEAFYVKTGLGETMTPDDILNGRLIVEIGMAAVRPAEFIVLRFSHKMQES